MEQPKSSSAQFEARYWASIGLANAHARSPAGITFCPLKNSGAPAHYSNASTTRK